MAIPAFQRLDHDLGPILGQAFDLRATGTQNLIGDNRHVCGFS